MAAYLYISTPGEDKIQMFTIDLQTGGLTLQGETAVPGSPSDLAISPDRKFVYVVRKGIQAISTYSRNLKTGELTLIGTLEVGLEPGYVSTDKKGNFLLSTYFWVGKVAVHPIGKDGIVTGPATEFFDTARGVHSVLTDPSNKYVYLPHIAVVGPNLILQFKFDEKTGHLTPNIPDRVVPAEPIGPRDFCFHPKLNIVYFGNEEGSNVTAYNFNRTNGTLSAFQTVSTIPDDFTAKNRCAEIHITKSGKCLYVANRGHNSMACFSIDAAGRLKSAGQVPCEAETRAFELDPEGNFLYAAGEKSNKLLAYRVNPETAELKLIETYTTGKGPWWISVVK
jgi:6-phosphogluconolactonase